MRYLLSVVFSLFLVSLASSQLLQDKKKFTHQDTLTGSITPGRAWWELTYYHLDISVDPENKYIQGKNTISYKVLEPNQIMQIDLQPPLEILKVTQNGKELKIKHDGNAHFITLKSKQKKGTLNSIEVYYKGNPKEARRAPWDGGFSWKQDPNGHPFVATSCQGLGASVWWPC
ncbi:MAG: M1 family peptidase, partial [Mangrovimonas sp.]|nr:M1 family peptidase [Mangrovimonas sp.]